MNLDGKTILLLGSSVTYGSAAGGVSHKPIIKNTWQTPYIPRSLDTANGGHRDLYASVKKFNLYTLQTNSRVR